MSGALNVGILGASSVGQIGAPRFGSYFFLLGTDHSLKVQSRMGDKVRIKNLKSLFDFFEKFSRE